MFLRTHRRNKDGKDHTYWSLVETVRTPDGPRQKTLCHLGELNDTAQARWMTGERRLWSTARAHERPRNQHPAPGSYLRPLS